MNYLYHIVFILVGIIMSGSLFLKKGTPTFLKAFCPFLSISIIVEVIGVYLSERSIHNIPLYNVFGLVEFCFYIWVLRELISGEKVKKLIFGLLIIFPTVSILDMTVIQGINSFNSVTYSLGCLFTIFLSMFYFLELFRKDENFRLNTNPAFWICTALLFYYSVSFPVFVSANLMKNFTPKIGNYIAYAVMILNIIFYSLFCVAFYCQLKYHSNKTTT